MNNNIKQLSNQFITIFDKFYESYESNDEEGKANALSELQSSWDEIKVFYEQNKNEYDDYISDFGEFVSEELMADGNPYENAHLINDKAADYEEFIENLIDLDDTTRAWNAIIEFWSDCEEEIGEEESKEDIKRRQWDDHYSNLLSKYTHSCIKQLKKDYLSVEANIVNNDDEIIKMIDDGLAMEYIFEMQVNTDGSPIIHSSPRHPLHYFQVVVNVENSARCYKPRKKREQMIYDRIYIVLKGGYFYKFCVLKN